MSGNPKRALEALTAGGVEVDGITVRELTLGLAAVLERIGSPLVTARAKGEALTLRDMLPTMFAMTRPAAESDALLTSGGAEALQAAAVRWADDLSTETGMKLVAACAAAVSRVARVSPQGLPDEDGPEGNGSAAGTAGSSPSPQSARSGSGGRGRRSTTARRSR